MKRSVRLVAGLVAIALGSTSVMAADANLPVPVQTPQAKDARVGAPIGQQDQLLGSGAALPLALLAAVLVGLGAYEAAKGKPNRRASP